MNNLLQETLGEEFFKRGQRNNNYSLRAFARDLGLAPSTLSEVLRGKKLLSPKRVREVGSLISLPIEIIIALEKYCEGGYSNIPLDSPEHINFIVNWYYPAILSLFETKESQSCPRWISERLNVSLPKVEKALKDMITLNFLEKSDKSEGIKLSVKKTSGMPQVPSEIFRKVKYQQIEKIRETLDRLEDQKTYKASDITSITLAIDPRKMPEAIKKIARFRRQISDFLYEGEREEVYTLFISLFPLTDSKT